VGVLGGVQPDKVEAIISGPDDGLSARILWCWPHSSGAFSLARVNSDETQAQSAFARLTELAIGSDEFGNPEPIRIQLASKAEDTIEEFARDMVRRGENASGILAGSLGKARGHVLRIATVLEFLWWCGRPNAHEPADISVDAVNAAAALVDAYFIPMAERVYGDAAVPPDEKAATILVRQLRQEGLAEFNARDLRRQVGGVLRDAQPMDKACNVLVEAGLIRPRKPPSDSRRRLKNYEVNPIIFGRQQS
jgi:hypothetical protein